MAKTNDSYQCHQYLKHYIEIIKSELHRYQIQLNEQKSSCPLKNFTMEQIDQSLHRFIDCQRNYLLARKSKQIKHFKAQIEEEKSYHWLSTLVLRSDQVCFCL